MFNVLSCLSHISFRMKYEIKFTTPYIFIEPQINYTADIQPMLVPHEPSRRSQYILSQNLFSLLHRDALRLDAWRKQHTYKMLVLFTSFVVWSHWKCRVVTVCNMSPYLISKENKWEWDTCQQTKKFSSLYRGWRLIIMFEDLPTSRCDLLRQFYSIPPSDIFFKGQDNGPSTLAMFLLLL